MKETVYVLLVSFLLLTSGTACKHDTAVVPALPPDTTGSGGAGGGGGVINPEDTALCFERDILPIFISNCAKSGCHDAASHEEGFVFTSYETITSKEFSAGNANDCELFEQITEDDADKIMPPPPNPPLTNAQIQLIARWINEGAENSTGCASLCDTNNFAFAANIQPIFTSGCIGCHNSGSPSGGIVLDNHAGIRSVALSGQLLGALRHQPGFTPMPQGGTKLSDCKIRQIEKWMESGAPNN